VKAADDIRALFEEDIRALTEALISGEIRLHDGRRLTDMGLSEGDVHHLAGEVQRFVLSARSLLLPYLSQMKWLELPLACIYARRGKKTLIRWIKERKIYGEQPDGEGADWVVDRESIDRLYYEKRDRVRAAVADRKGERR
jgi:hypothetical protein